MTVPHLAETDLADAVPSVRLLEGLAKLHRWILLIDARRRVVWASEGLSDFPGTEELVRGVDARNFLAHLPRPQQVFPLRSSLRGRDRVEGAPIELETRGGGRVAIELDLVRIESGSAEGGELLLVIGSEHRAEAGEGPSRDDLDCQLVQTLPEPLLAVDASGIVRRANEAALRLLEVSEDQVLNRAITTLLAERVEHLESLVSVLAARSRGVARDLPLHARSGEERTLEAWVTPLGGSHRSVLLRDVTEQRRAERRLEQSGEELDQCIGALAHDLRSPLVGLLGFSRLLRQDYAAVLDDTGRHFIDRIEQASRTMETLIQDLLELARVGEADERPALSDPREVLLQIAAELKPRLDAAGLALELVDGLPSRVDCERSHLYQIFSNLIGNAIEHMGSPADARIEVRVDERDGGHEIVVSDNGRGVAPENQDRIFEIFQSFGARPDGRRGTGMGLAIVKRIAEKHGGRAWIESSPGAGARFHVTLPAR